MLGTQVFIRHSTISGNTADGSGGGIDNADGSFTLRNTIMAENTAATSPIGGGSSNDCHGNIDSDDFNLIGTTDGCNALTQANDLTGTDAAPVDPLLLPLGDYGGLSQTLPLDAGSPAIDSGGVCPLYDQRGHQRPADGGSGVATCDRGAVEVNGSCGPPLPAEPLEPADGAAGVVLAPLLVWEPAYNALTYDVVLATEPPPAGVPGDRVRHHRDRLEAGGGPVAGHHLLLAGPGHSPCGRRVLSAAFSFTTQ